MEISRIATVPVVVPPAARAAGLPPLHQRTPDQLRDGMVVAVKGAGSDDLAVARLIQDGAQYMARVAGTTMGLANVDINSKSIDRAGALGMATFYGGKGWFGLSQQSTTGLMEGIQRLRTTPWGEWTESQRQSFVQANEVILHEAGHVTLDSYTPAAISKWAGAPRDFEEGLTEIATMTRIGDFMREEFGVEVGSLTDRISQSTSSYTRYTERIARMLEMGGDGSAAALREAASLVSDRVPADQRLNVIAQRVADNLGGPGVPRELVAEFAKTLPGFVAEENGTRTKLMKLQGAFVDIKAGKAVDVAALLADVRALDLPAGRPASPPVGTEPIA